MTQLRKKKLSQKGDVLLDVLKSHRKHSARVLQFRKTFQHNKNDKPIKLHDIVLLAAHHLSRWVYCFVFNVLQSYCPDEKIQKFDNKPKICDRTPFLKKNFTPLSHN